MGSSTSGNNRSCETIDSGEEGKKSYEDPSAGSFSADTTEDAHDCCAGDIGDIGGRDETAGTVMFKVGAELVAELLAFPGVWTLGGGARDVTLPPPPKAAPTVDAALIAAVSVLSGGLEVRCGHGVLLSAMPRNVEIGFTGGDEADICDETMGGVSCENWEGGDGEGDAEEETGAELDGEGRFEFEGWLKD